MKIWSKIKKQDSESPDLFLSERNYWYYQHIQNVYLLIVAVAVLVPTVVNQYGTFYDFKQGKDNYILWYGYKLETIDMILVDHNGNDVGYIYSKKYGNDSNLKIDPYHYSNNSIFWNAQTVNLYKNGKKIVSVAPGKYKIKIVQPDGVEIFSSEFLID